MLTLSAQFKDAIRNVSVDDKAERARRAHQEVRDLLERNKTLQGWGVDTVLIGSYARHTAIFPGRDVDVFTKLTELDTSESPEVVFDVVANILVEQYGDRAEARARSVKIEFGDDFSVDVVPAVRSGTRWALPRHDRSRWQNLEDAWVDTDPEELTRLTQKLNGKVQIAGNGAYIPIVRLIRQTRLCHLGKNQKPGGLYFELLTYWTFFGGLSAGSHAELFSAALSGIALGIGKELIDPALGTAYAPPPDPIDLSAAARTFATLADMATKALSSDDECEAAAIWRRIIGVNDRGACFPLPPGCDERGNRIPIVSANLDAGTSEARPYA